MCQSELMFRKPSFVGGCKRQHRKDRNEPIKAFDKQMLLEQGTN